MLQILFTWLFILMFTITGGIILQTYGLNKHNDSFLFIVTSGLTLLIFYVQLYSLFLPVKSCTSLAILALIFIILILIKKGTFTKLLKQYKDNYSFKENIPLVIFTILYFLVILIKSTQTPTDTDDYLYHCQAVRWCEEYGVVKGSGLINSRISFNSSLFPLFALFGFRDIFNETIHGTNGFVMFISMVALLQMFLKKKNASSFACFFIGLYYVRTLNYSIQSFNTDMIPNVFIACFVCLWLNSSTNLEKANNFLLLVATITMKLSFAPLLLFSLEPIFHLFKENNKKIILFYLVLGFIIALPYFIRNYYISGWLLYPLSIIDIFNVEWKIPKELVLDQANWVYAWAWNPIYGIDLIENGAPFIEKLKVWITWTSTKYTRVVLIILLITFTVFIIINLIRFIKKNKLDYSFIFTIFCLFIEFIYWFLSAPDIRFTFVSIYLIPILLLSKLPLVTKIIDKYFNKYTSYLLIGAAILLFIIKIDLPSCNASLLSQSPFNDCDCDEYHLTTKITLYSNTSNITGINVFPGSDSAYLLKSIEPLGEDIKDGFKYKSQ